MVELINKDAIEDFQFAFYDGAIGFYIITASPDMQKQICNAFSSENVAVYDYSGKKNTDRFSPGDIIGFIEDNNDKEVCFILNFQIPFLGKEAKTTQPDYFALNMCRDLLHEYGKKIFFFTSKEMERNISIAAMDFFDYCFRRIDFENEKKEEIEKQIKRLDENYNNIHHTDEIKYRLNLYKDKIEEYLNIDMDKYSDIFIEKNKTLTKEEKKSQNYLLVAARDLSYFGGLYKKISDFDKALELYNKEFDIRKKIQAEENADIATLYNDIGYVYGSQGDYSKALEYYQKALKIREKILGNEHPGVAMLYNNIGAVYDSLGDYSQALEYYQKALKIFEKIYRNEHPNIATTYNNIGGVYDSQGNYSKALEFYQKALKIDEKVLGNEHPDVATDYNNIGYVYKSQGDYSKALEYLQKALKIDKKTLGDNHHYTISTKNAIEEINNHGK